MTVLKDLCEQISGNWLSPSRRLTIIRKMSSGTLRGWWHSAHAEEWLKKTGASDTSRTSCIVSTDTCARSTIIPRRFISCTTTWCQHITAVHLMHDNLASTYNSGSSHARQPDVNTSQRFISCTTTWCQHITAVHLMHDNLASTGLIARGRGQWLAFGIVLEKRIEYGRIRHFNN